jgi:hypothetical protein
MPVKGIIIFDPFFEPYQFLFSLLHSAFEASSATKAEDQQEDYTSQ